MQPDLRKDAIAVQLAHDEELELTVSCARRRNMLKVPGFLEKNEKY